MNPQDPFDKKELSFGLVCAAIMVVVSAFLYASAVFAQINFNGKAEIEKVQEEVEVKRELLLNEYHNAIDKQAVLDETRTYVEDTLLSKVFPVWMGMPWTMAVIKDGLKPDAKYPGEYKKGISCSWFVVAALENVGFRFSNRKKFAGTIAIHFQKSMTPNKKNITRMFNISAAQLKDKMIKKGDGIYIIGLNCHIGFVSVRGETVEFIHSSYLAPWEVVREPLETSGAIIASESKGFVVSNLFEDTYLLLHWLGNTKIPFRKTN